MCVEGLEMVSVWILVSLAYHLAESSIYGQVITSS